MTTYVSALYTTILFMRYAKEAYEWYAWLPAVPSVFFPSYWWPSPALPPPPPPPSSLTQQHETIATLVNQYVGD